MEEICILPPGMLDRERSGSAAARQRRRLQPVMRNLFEFVLVLLVVPKMRPHQALPELALVRNGEMQKFVDLSTGYLTTVSSSMKILFLF